MAAITNQRGTILQIVGDVFRRMNYTPPVSLSANQTALKYTGFLNDIVQAVSDFGDWPQQYEEVSVTAAACAVNVEINASAPIKRILEVHYKDQQTPLVPVEIRDVRRLQRTSGQGAPRQFAVVRTSGINPIVRIDRRETTTAMGFNVAVYTSPLEYTSSDASKVPPWSRRMLVQGLYAMALLDENDGVPTNHYQANYAVFRNHMQEEYNRLGADTTQEMRLTVRR